jgi:hypothetical protein
MDRSSNPSASAAGVLAKELLRIAAAEDIKISRREDFKMEVSRLDTVDNTVKPLIVTARLKAVTKASLWIMMC